MQFSSVSSNNRLVLNLGSPGKELSFNKGEIIRGIVQEVMPNGLVLLTLKGNNIEALTEVAVKPGQQLYLLVDEFKDGKTYLKVVNPQMREELENINIRSNLRNMGIKVTDNTLELARKLLQHDMPVNSNNLNDLQRNVKMLGENNDRNLELAVFALSRGIKAKPELLTALRQFVSKQNNIKDLFDSLLKIINKLDNRPVSMNINMNEADNSRQTEASIKANISRPGVYSDLNLSKQEVNPEVKAGQNAIQDRSVPLSIINGTSPENDKVKQGGNLQRDLMLLLRNLLELIEIDAELEPTQIKEKLQNTVQSEKTIIRAIHLLKELLDNKVVPDKISSLDNLSVKLNNLEKELLGQSIFNTANRGTTDSTANYYYFSFPVKMNENYQLCQLKINHDNKPSGFKNADQLSFVVSLDTLRMGIVLFQVNWFKSGEIYLQGIVENQKTADYFDDNIEELLTRLKDLGYQVKNLGIKVSDSSENLSYLKPILKEIPEKIKPFRIDVKA